MLLLQTDHHATEVLTDKCLKKLMNGVALLDLVVLKDFICEVCACFKSEPLGQNEGVVAIEEDILDLSFASFVSC
jgi:hypothetical protein